MLIYKRIDQADRELFHFCQKQKEYYELENQEVTWEYIQNDFHAPEGFENEEHYFYKIYDDEHMIGYIDYLIGYRYHMIHDKHYLWIGLFLVDQLHQRQHYGQRIIHHLIHQHQDITHIQLACLNHNLKGLAFWKSLGFHPIAKSSYNDLKVIVLEKEQSDERGQS